MALLAESTNKPPLHVANSAETRALLDITAGLHFKFHTILCLRELCYACCIHPLRLPVIIPEFHQRGRQQNNSPVSFRWWDAVERTLAASDFLRSPIGVLILKALGFELSNGSMARYFNDVFICHDVNFKGNRFSSALTHSFFTALCKRGPFPFSRSVFSAARWRAMLVTFCIRSLHSTQKHIATLFALSMRSHRSGTKSFSALYFSLLLATSPLFTVVT